MGGEDMVLDTYIMTRTLNILLGVFESGAGRLQGAGMGILGILISIEITWAGLMMAFATVDDAMKQFLRKIVHVGMFAFIVMNFPQLANIVLKGFAWAGVEAGGSELGMAAMRNPSMIVNLGFEATKQAWADVGVPFLSDGAMSAFIMLLVSLVSMVLYFMLALQIFVTLVEFYIITTFGVVFIPWGVNRHTAFIAERYFGAIIAQGTKLMVLSTLVSVLWPVMASLKLPSDPTFTQVMSLFFGVATIAYVVKRAPEVAGGLMSGSASLTGSDMMSASTGAAGTAAGVAGVAAAPVTAGGSMVAGGAAKAASMGANVLQSSGGSASESSADAAESAATTNSSDGETS